VRSTAYLLSDHASRLLEVSEVALRGAVVEEGAWLAHALHIDVDEAWEPLDAVHTWFDMQPFSRMAAGEAE
jgi:hypothetical protein